MGKKKTFAEQEELDIISYYLTPFTLTETSKHFSLTKDQVRRVLNSNSISLHSKEINNQAKLNKTTATNIKKYGVVNTFQSPKGKEGFKNFYSDKNKIEKSIIKNKNTKLEKYGDENYNNANKTRQTRIEKYGVENFFQDKYIHDKALNNAKTKEAKTKKKQTCFKHFGVEYSLAASQIREKIENTNIKKYGGVSPSCSDRVKDKMRETNRIKYGKDYYTQTEEYKERHQITWNKKTEEEKREIVDRVSRTKRMNHSFNTSTSEEIFYKVLVDKFGKRNIQRQYIDKNRYPFHCDFYITSLDIFIELNLFFTHGGHPFDKDNFHDLETLKIWKDKSSISQFYKNAIETWTIKDPLKIKTASTNNLNFYNFYSLDEALEFIKKLN